YPSMNRELQEVTVNYLNEDQKLFYKLTVIGIICWTIFLILSFLKSLLLKEAIWWILVFPILELFHVAAIFTLGYSAYKKGSRDEYFRKKIYILIWLFAIFLVIIFSNISL